MLLLHLYNHHHIIIIVAVGERADDDDQHILHKNVDDCSVINLQKMTSLSAEFSTEKECHLNFMQWWRRSHHSKMIAQINSVTRNTKEMQNYTGEKSILAVFEEILLKSCLEHSKLQKDKTKVTEGRGKTPPVPGQGLTRSQNSCRNQFSSKNGREISSSVYGTTRWPQL